MAEIGNRQRAVTAMKIISAALLVLRLPEIGQDIIIAPAAISLLAPAIIVLVLAANVKQAVDRTRSRPRPCRAAGRWFAASPGSGSVWYIQLTVLFLNSMPYPSGTWIQRLVSSDRPRAAAPNSSRLG